MELMNQNCNFNYSTQILSELRLQNLMLGEYLLCTRGRHPHTQDKFEPLNLLMTLGIELQDLPLCILPQ